MDKAKYEAYKRYDWGGDEKWQQYLNGLYPTPPRDRLEKLRRKWYKKNKVSDFDVDFNEEQFINQQNQRQGAGMSDQQRFQQQYYQQYAQQNPGAHYSGNQTNFHDQAPQFAQVHLLLWLGYIASLFIGTYSTIVGVLANLMGLIRKCGTPKWSNPIQFIQAATMQEDFANVTYFMATAMSNGGLLVSGPMIISALLFLSTEFSKKLRANPSMPVLSIGQVKNLIEKGSSHEIQNYGRQMKADMEVYCGFYLIGMAFLGGSSLIGVVLFWQMQRMRYMISTPLQMAYSRMDQNIQGYLNMSWCPGIIRTAYFGLRSMLQNMTDVQAQQQRMAQGGGGLMSNLKNSCSIF